MQLKTIEQDEEDIELPNFDSNFSNVQEQAVFEFCHRDAIFHKNIVRGTVNVNGLASYIIRDLNLSLPDHKVRHIIKRFVTLNKLRLLKRRVNADRLFAKTDISSQTGVALIAIVACDHTKKLVGKINDAVNEYGNETFMVVQNDKKILLTVNEKDISKVEEMVGSKYILEIKTNLTKIRFIQPVESSDVPGVFATILNEIAVHDINIQEAHTLRSDYCIYVAREDGASTYNLFEALINRCKKRVTRG